jgi:prepilin-type N-terminal cleavage/methylation domain-containing protein/prepilin-type processing-associated H-X9-DG protein
MNTKGDRAFTLLELLVVIAVVVILLGLLLPGINQAKSKSRDLICRGNLKQWGVATHLYITDHEDFLPAEGNPNPRDSSTNTGWYISLPREMGMPRYHDMQWRTNASFDPGRSIWICPANERRSNGNNLFHYCLNEHVNRTGAFNYPIKYSSIGRPSVVVWLFDTKNLPAVGYWGFVHTNLHAGGAHFLFLDGHVSWFKNLEYWDFTSNKGRTNHPEIVWRP